MPSPRQPQLPTQVTALPKKQDRPDVYPEGRHCIDCGHTLSVFNPGPDCHACSLDRVTPLKSYRAELLECMRQAA